MATVFFFKENNTNDRDCVKYLDIHSGMPQICGTCFSGMWGDYPAYENVTTILTEGEYNALCHVKDADNDMDMQAIFFKLNSYENDELFEKVQQEEIEYLMDEYNLDEKEVIGIFNDYTEYYRDRSIVSYVYDNAYDLGYATADEWGYLNNDNIPNMERYFDFQQFGEDLCDDYDYYELDDGRIVSLNY